MRRYLFGEVQLIFGERNKMWSTRDLRVVVFAALVSGGLGFCCSAGSKRAPVLRAAGDDDSASPLDLLDGASMTYYIYYT